MWLYMICMICIIFFFFFHCYDVFVIELWYLSIFCNDMCYLMLVNTIIWYSIVIRYVVIFVSFNIDMRCLFYFMSFKRCCCILFVCCMSFWDGFQYIMFILCAYYVFLYWIKSFNSFFISFCDTLLYIVICIVLVYFSFNFGVFII